MILKENLEKGKEISLISNSEEETKKIAKDILDAIPSNATIILTGNLGTGKTKFTEGVLEKYGLEDQISSPTFTIINEYENDEKTIYHFDVYRLSDSMEFYDIGGDEYLGKALSIIEWGELIENILNIVYYKITIEKIYEEELEIENNINDNLEEKLDDNSFSNPKRKITIKKIDRRKV